jgi:plastocyanin
MKQLPVALAICLSLGLGVAACGGDDDNGDNGDGGGNAATTEQTAPKEKKAAGGGATAGAAKPFEIAIVDIDYDPKDATVKKGVTVKWTNTGNLPHTVTKDDGPGPDFDSGTIQPGDTFEETFATAGKIGYLCTIHSGQTGSLTVQ